MTISISKLASIVGLLLAPLSGVIGQTLPGNYTTSWVGNTIVPTEANNRGVVQGWANSMFVDADGTIYANCFWDESARELSIYKDGKAIDLIPNQHGAADGGAITVNAQYVWASENEGQIARFPKNCLGCGTSMISSSTLTIRGLAASATEVFASDFAAGQIKVYSAADNNLLRSWPITRPGPLSLDADGNIWVLCYDAQEYGPGTGACIKAYSKTGSLLKTITLPAEVEAKSIVVDKIKNELLLTDIGDNMQIHIYNNINTTPTFAQSLGVKRGILSGTKGLVAPLKFNVPNLVGVDNKSNIIVWSNGNNTDIVKLVDADGMGSCVESYTRAGVRNWEMLGLEFVDMASYDPATDGADLYTKHEHFTMDYSKPDGQQWTWKGWTVDRAAYGDNDVRTRNGGGHLSTPMMRRINGNLYMYLNSMSGGGFSFFRFTTKDEIAMPCGDIWGKGQWNDINGNGLKDAGETTSKVLWQYDMFGNCVDNKGDIWFAFDDIRKHKMQSITNGAPIYNSTPEIITTPDPFNSLRRVEYDSDNDIMYLSGYTAALPYTGDWKSTGTVMARYNNWSTGNRSATYTITLPSKTSGELSNMVSTAVEKDYIFVVGVETRGKVWVYNSSNGTLAGTMIPGDNIGGVEFTGWCDMVNSIDAFKTKSGKYLVTVEEDGWQKVIVYIWCPTKVCENVTAAENNVEENGVKIFPNPTKSTITVQGLSIENARYDITSIDGKILQSGVVTTGSVSVENLNSGIYFIKINTDAGDRVMRFVKE